MATLHSVGLYLTTLNTHKGQTSMQPAGADPHRRPRGHWDRLFWHLVDSEYSSELNFTAPLCDSSKCLLVDCTRKSEFGVRKTDEGWEFITYKITGWTKLERLKVEDRLCSPSVPLQLYCSIYRRKLHVSATPQPSSGCIYQNCKRKLCTCSLHIVTNY